MTVVENTITITIYLVAGVVILGIFGTLSGNLITFIGLITAAITLSLQDILRNLVAGVFLLLEQPFAIGDRIKVGTDEGVIERVGIRTSTILEQPPGAGIPNIVRSPRPSPTAPVAARISPTRHPGLSRDRHRPWPGRPPRRHSRRPERYARPGPGRRRSRRRGRQRCRRRPPGHPAPSPNTLAPSGPIVVALRAAFPTATITRVRDGW